jgi:hypothetical protein
MSVRNDRTLLAVVSLLAGYVMLLVAGLFGPMLAHCGWHFCP